MFNVGLVILCSIFEDNYLYHFEQMQFKKKCDMQENTLRKINNLKNSHKKGNEYFFKQMDYFKRKVYFFLFYVVMCHFYSIKTKHNIQYIGTKHNQNVFKTYYS